MRIAAILLAAIWAIAAQDKKACDLKKVEDAWYCEGCKKILDKESCGAEACKDQKPKKIRVCVKTYYTEDFGTGKDG